MSSAHTYLPSTSEIRDTVAEEIASLGGAITDVVDDEGRLFVRAVLTPDAEIGPGDTVRAGIAVRATPSEILVHPYTFRQVCTNGAIVAHALQSRRLERIECTSVFVPAYDVAVILTDLGAAVRACAAPEAFVTTVNDMRSIAEMDAEMALQMLHSLARLPQHMATRLLPQILERFAASSDRSAFGLMNAVTSVARDTPDAATRWNLEQLGAALCTRLARLRRLAPAIAGATM